MNIDLKIFSHKKHFKKRGASIKPHLYWRYILIFTFVLALLLCAFGWYLFIKVDRASNLPQINLDKQGEINETRILEALDYSKKKQEKSLDILNSPSPIVDPSI